jgi:hypothetical protein
MRVAFTARVERKEPDVSQPVIENPREPFGDLHIPKRGSAVCVLKPKKGFHVRAAYRGFPRFLTFPGFWVVAVDGREEMYSAEDFYPRNPLDVYRLEVRACRSVRVLESHRDGTTTCIASVRLRSNKLPARYSAIHAAHLKLVAHLEKSRDMSKLRPTNEGAQDALR